MSATDTQGTCSCVQLQVVNKPLKLFEKDKVYFPVRYSELVFEPITVKQRHYREKK